MEFVPILAMIALTKKTVDLIKELVPNDVSNKAVQLIAMVVGVGYAFLFAVSTFGGSIDVGGTSLAALDPFAVAIVGLVNGAGAGVVNDATERRNPDADPD